MGGSPLTVFESLSKGIFGRRSRFNSDESGDSNGDDLPSLAAQLSRAEIWRETMQRFLSDWDSAGAAQWSPAVQSEAVQGLWHRLEATEPMVALTQTEFDAALDSLEDALLARLYGRVYSPALSDDVQEDSIVLTRSAYLRARELSPHALGLPESTFMPATLHALVAAVSGKWNRIKTERTPRAKLFVLLQVLGCVMECLAQSNNASPVRESSPIRASISTASIETITVEAVNDPLANPPSPQIMQRAQKTSADMVLPLLIYALVYPQPDDVVSQTRFVQRFRRASALNGETGYGFTMICAAVSFLQTENIEELVGEDPDVELQMPKRSTAPTKLKVALLTPTSEIQAVDTEAPSGVSTASFFSAYSPGSILSNVRPIPLQINLPGMLQAPQNVAISAISGAGNLTAQASDFASKIAAKTIDTLKDFTNSNSANNNG